MFKYVGRTGNISRGRSEGFHFKHDFGIKKRKGLKLHKTTVTVINGEETFGVVYIRVNN